MVKPKPFKGFNILTRHERFLAEVKGIWAQQVSGFHMYRVVKKLKLLKKPFRKLLYEKGNLHANVIRFRTELDSIQTLLDLDPFNANLREAEAASYFHKAVKSRVSRSRIDAVTNTEGVVFENNAVPDAFVSHYETFLGLAGETSGFNTANLFKTCLNEQVASDMVRNVTAQEVKEALFSMGDDKSPGPDGYTTAFFKEAWDVVANDVTNAICEFFRNGTLLKELNHTIIALIPKELMHNYHLDRGTPRCAFKVDIQKAYDTVDWDFLRMVLHGFGFHDRMISWIMECVATTSYSICVNGSLHGYFQGNRGVRQGDPLTPYLFTLAMEVLTLMLQRKVQDSDLFTYHRYCSKLELINLCFADDLFLFAYCDVQSATVIKEALEEFKEGKLLVKYLGVPLVPSRLMIRDCNKLLDRVQIRIQDWKNKSLSIAGRLQLIKSVLGSMHIYWASVFILPSRVLLNIEQLMRGFLWCHGSLKKGKAKVAWEVVCLPKDEGRLGIRHLECFNSALMVAHIWKLLSLKESVWVKWIHEYKLNARNFWDIPLRGNMWCDSGPLASNISYRDIFRAGLNLTSKVKDVIHNSTWLWPPDLLVKYPFLNECHVPIVEGNSDVPVWRNSLGITRHFSVSQVWSDIRPRDTKVDWYNMVWFASCIPRHAFNLWLIVRIKLKTQDLVRAWDVSNSLGTSCSLCGGQPDSHDHLFFECSFAHAIWDRMKVLAGLDSSPPNIYSIINDLLPIARRRSTTSVVAKLVVAASAYFIWQERNWWLFNKFKKTPTQACECIMSSVRLKLLSCWLKKSKNGERMARLWNLPKAWLFKLWLENKPNGKLLYNSIINGPYVRRMVPKPGHPDREVPIVETFHEQTHDVSTEKEVKQMEADDQAIHTILMGLPKDIYAVVDSCETAQEIWLRVQQMMKGSDIGA
ncbi:hypothetical protein Tco_0205111 [Tanacetum coccineum]